MEITLSRTIRPAQFESMTYSVTVTEADIDSNRPSPDPYTTGDRMELKAYKRILAWEVFNGHKTKETASGEISRLRKALKQRD